MKMNNITYLFVLVFMGCSSDDVPFAIETTDDKQKEEITVISEEQFERQEMELDTLSLRSFGGSIHCTGIIDVPPEFKADVSSYFGGYVKRIQLVSGTYVKKGQALFTLENPDFIEVQREFLEKKNEVELLHSEYQRQEQLSKNNATSSKALNQAKSAFEIAEVAKKSLEKKLLLMNIDHEKLSADNLRSTIAVRSPINGYVTSVNISTGMFLDPHQVAISIEGADHKHMEFQVYEKDLEHINIGDPIKMIAASHPSKSYAGEVYLIDKNIQAENRTVKVHGHFINEPKALEKLLPQMYIEGEIFTHSIKQLAIQERAIVSVDDQQYVLVLQKHANNEYSFIKKEVQTGETANGFTEILNPKDFSKQTKILTKGAFQLIK